MRYAIIGAGLAGLTAAVEIRRADPQANIDVYEASERIGGKLHTVAFEAGRVDVGAEAFLNSRADKEFFDSLGLSRRIVHPSKARSALYAGGQWTHLPRGGVMGIPADSAPVAHLVDEATAARIDAEGKAAPIDWQVGGDVSVGKLVRQRYGDQVVDRAVSALLGGVYSCGADDLGLRATIPALAEALDRMDRPTLSGAVRAVEAARSTRPTGSGAPMFSTFAGGFAELYEALAEASGADIYLDEFISAVSSYSSGSSGSAVLKIKEHIYDRVLLATPAPTTALLLRQLNPEASAALAQVELANSVVVAMRFAHTEGLPDNSGVLIATDEPGLHAKAFTFSSNKWPHLPGGLVRASFGRYGDDAVTRAEEDDLVDWALDDLARLTGFDGRAAGLEEIYVQRWFGGLPRYSPTHLDTVAKVRTLLAEDPRLGVTGAWAGGVGIPAVIADARAAARAIARRVIGG